MNKRNQKRSGLNKEKASVIAASVFVLSALTLTGVYMAAQNNSKTEENRIDFAQLEQQQNKAKTEQTILSFVVEMDRRNLDIWHVHLKKDLSLMNIY